VIIGSSHRLHQPLHAAGRAGAAGSNTADVMSGARTRGGRCEVSHNLHSGILMLPLMSLSSVLTPQVA